MRPTSVGDKERTVNMALFTRKALQDKGLDEDQVEYIMSVANSKIDEYYELKSEVQAKIDAAVATAKSSVTPAPKVTETEEYKAIAKERDTIANERDMLRALGGEDFAEVKPKFREAVYKLLDHEEGAKPVSEQMSGIREQYEEYFSTQKAQEPPENKPTFSAPSEGGMPKGGNASFGDYWGFKKG